MSEMHQKVANAIKDKLMEVKKRSDTVTYGEVAKAALEALMYPDHETTAAVLKPGEDRSELVNHWNDMLREILK